MPKYHIVPTTGNPGVCKAQYSCPFGDMTSDHFDNKADARKHYEENMENYVHLEPGKWIRAGGTSKPYRLHTSEELEYLNDQVKKTMHSIANLALGPRGDRGLDALNEIVDPVSDRGYSRPFSPEKALVGIGKAKRFIQNPSAANDLVEMQNLIKATMGKPSEPKKNEKVMYRDEYGQERFGTFVKKEVDRGSSYNRQQWGDLAIKEYGYVQRENSSSPVKVPMGTILRENGAPFMDTR